MYSEHMVLRGAAVCWMATHGRVTLAGVKFLQVLGGNTRCRNPNLSAYSVTKFRCLERGTMAPRLNSSGGNDECLN